MRHAVAYYCLADAPGSVDRVPATQFRLSLPNQADFHRFHDSVAAKFGWRESTAGWCTILQESGGDDRRALEFFFELIDEYRKANG
jgi:hypothetical protein